MKNFRKWLAVILFSILLVGICPVTALAASFYDEDAVDGQMVSAGNLVVGDGVTASFNETTGEVLLYSNGGTLWKGWIEKANLSAADIKSVKAADSSGTIFLPEDSSEMFMVSYFNPAELDLSKFNTSRVTDMSDIFYGCNRLKELDLSSFDTSNVKDMSGMFDECHGLTKLDLTHFDTSNVTNMAHMFADCYNLAEFDLSSFDTSNVTDMNGMFKGLRKLTTLELSGFNTSKVTDMDQMFDYSDFTELDLSSFNTPNLKTVRYMFGSCQYLENLDISNFEISNAAETHGMLLGTDNLQVLKTPEKNALSSIELPHVMYDINAASYTSLPIVSESIVLAISPQLAGEATYPVEDITMDKQKLFIKNGESSRLTASVFPESAFNKDVLWTSSDENVAVVDSEGNITTRNAGTAIITATTVDGSFQSTCTVSVKTGLEFTDMTDLSTWYYDSVCWAVGNGVTSGMGEGTFQPLANLSRAQTVMFLYKLAEQPDVSDLSDPGFKDVTSDKWYYNAVKWAVANEITSGYGEGTFQPNVTCNRAMIVTFLMRYSKLAGTYVAPESHASFKDVPADAWFREAVDWAVASSVTTGYGEGTFQPMRTCNRAMMVTFLKRVAELPKVSAE